MERHETEPLPPWVERLKATTPEEIARAKEYERKLRIELLLRYEEPPAPAHIPHTGAIFRPLGYDGHRWHTDFVIEETT